MGSNNARLQVLVEIRAILLVMAEPQLAERDRSRRADLRKLVGRSEKGQKAVLLMDGSRTQAEISKTVPIDNGQLARLVGSLREMNLIVEGEKPKIVIPVSVAMFTAEVA